ncbi:hypothetical protein JCM3775_002969 [Rhodotorula graminis]
MRASAHWAWLTAVLVAAPAATSARAGAGAGAGASGGSTRLRAPSVETHAARWAGSVLEAGAAAGARWDASASLGKGVAALWMPPSSHAVEPAPFDEAPAVDDGGDWWDEVSVDPLSPEERAAAAEEERALWVALLSAVSESGEVAVQFRDLVGDADDNYNELACATLTAPTSEDESARDLENSNT